ncbi:MAG TPA: FtsX-like permease family protein [Gemmatimonadaceae bacterium]
MSSISLGVAALVAIDSFADNVTRSVREQSRALLGGDLAFGARVPFVPAVDSLLDSLDANGVGVSRVTTFASMGLVPRTGQTRLVQVRAVTPNYPFYGAITTDPAAAWARLADGSGAWAVVDPSLLVSLDARVGDTLTLGYGRFEIAGTIRAVPGDVGISAAIGPRVFIPARYTGDTQLLTVGSRAEYDALLRLPDESAAEGLKDRWRDRLDSARVRIRTVADTEEDLTEAIDQLREFLAIVGLVALLLGGIGVASGVHAFVTKKIDTVAVLRCLGATSGQVLAIYVLQATVMGILGAAAGAALGVAFQFSLPHLVGDFLPVDVEVAVAPRAIVLGLVVGAWVALVFALRPLLALRNISPLQAIRREDAGTLLHLRWRDWPRLGVALAIVGSVVAIAVLRTGAVDRGLGMSAAIGVVVAMLALAAGALVRGARRLVRARWPFVARQGVANLHRPGNQTRAVVLALGFGVFLVGTVYQVQTSLLARLRLSADATRANLVFFDIQEEQAAPLDSIVRAQGHEVVQSVPIVPMRIAAINSVPVADLLADTTVRRARWALRREYRSTYRDAVVGSERVVEGRWFGDRAETPDDDAVREVSMEVEVASELGVALGDTITWDVQGVRVPVRVTSLRTVDWARFEPNFFAVFEPAALEGAPKQFVMLAGVEEAAGMATLQGETVRRFPNVSSLDLTLVQRTIAGVLERVALAVRFMAVLSFALGIPVLFSAVAATRRERLREGVLLKTLGATRAQVGRVMLVEYAALGALGSLAGMILSIGGAWALARFVFEVPFVPAVVPALAIAAAMVALATTIGVLTGREVFRETPMAALREG